MAKNRSGVGGVGRRVRRVGVSTRRKVPNIERLTAPAVRVHNLPTDDKALKRKRRQQAQVRYRASPRGRYQQQKARAKIRGVGFELTFTEWCEIWEESGHYDERGNFCEGYVMCRVGDQGPYAVGNVYIGRHVDNVAERNRSYFWSRRHPMVDPHDPDYAHVHSAPDIDSSQPVRGAGDPANFPDVPF